MSTSGEAPQPSKLCRAALVCLALISCRPSAPSAVGRGDDTLTSGSDPAPVFGGAFGTDGSKLFPIGVWYFNGFEREAAYYYSDSKTFYQETMSQVRGLGFNTVMAVNLDRQHMKTALDAAADAQLNVIATLSELSSFAGRDWQTNACFTPTPTDQQAHDLAQSVAADFAGHPALLYYQLEDEPADCQLENKRMLSKWLSVFDPVHSSFGSNYVPSSLAQPASFGYQDRVLGYEQFTCDRYGYANEIEQDPIWSGGGSAPLAFEDAWLATPPDKPLYAVIQAFSQTNSPFWTPSPAILRYRMYSALARGAKGIFFFIDQSTRDGTGGILDFDYDRVGNDPVRGLAGMRDVPQLNQELSTLAPFLAEATRDYNPLHPHGCGGQSNTGLGAWVPSPRIDADCDLFTFTSAFNDKMLMLVNKHLTTQTYDLFLDKSTMGFAPGAQLIDTRSGAAILYVDNGSQLEVQQTLGAGDGVLIRVVPLFDASLRVRQGEVWNPISLGTTASMRVVVTNTGTATWNAPGTPTVRFVSSWASNNFNVTRPMPPGTSQTVRINIPTGPGTSIAANGNFQMAYYLAADSGPLFGYMAPTTLIVRPNPLLVDTFDTPPLKTNMQDALWKWERAPLMNIRDGRLAMNGGGLALSRYPDTAHGGAPFTDYTFELDVEIDNPNDSASAGWVVRGGHDGGDHGYVFELRHTGNSGMLYRYALSGGTLIPEGQTAVTGPLVGLGKWHHIRQQVYGNQITTYWEGSPTAIDQFQISTLPPALQFTQGTVGFYALDGGTLATTWHAHYDNVVVYNDSGTPLPPAAPVLSPTSNVPGRVRLNWSYGTEPTTGGADISYYSVFYAFGPGGPYHWFANSTLPWANDWAPPGRTYYYVAQATAANGQVSPYSNEVTGSVPIAPAAVGALTATATTARGVHLSYSAGAGTDHCNVYRTPGGSGRYSTSASALVTSRAGLAGFDDAPTNAFVDDLQLGPRPWGTYTYAVQPVDATGNTGPIATAIVTLPGSLVASDDFSAQSGDWTVMSGTWQQGPKFYEQPDASQCGVTTTLSTAGAAHDDASVANVVVEVGVLITNQGESANDWAGVLLHKNGINDGFWQSGYLVYYRANGNLEIYDIVDGVVATAATGIAPTNAFHALRVEIRGYRYRVFIDGVKYLDWTDPSKRFGSGYVSLVTCKAAAKFQGFNLYYREPFTDSLDGWTVVTSGTAASASYGQLVLSAAGDAVIGLDGARVRDFNASFDVINDSDYTGSNQGWSGFTFRKNHAGDTFQNSGYLVWLRNDGVLGISMGPRLLSQVATTAARHVTHRIDVRASGPQFQVYLDGAWQLTATDSTFAAGYVDLTVHDAASRFNFLEID